MQQLAECDGVGRFSWDSSDQCRPVVPECAENHARDGHDPDSKHESVFLGADGHDFEPVVPALGLPDAAFSYLHSHGTLDQEHTQHFELLMDRIEAPADGVVSAFFRKHRELGSRERHALAETAYAVLRRRLLFQHLAQSGAGPLERRLVALGWQGGEALLRAALTPPEREWLDRARSIDVATLPEKLRHNLPDWVAGPLKAALGEAGFWPLVESLEQPAPLDLRVNALRAKRDEVRAALAEAGIEADPTPYSPWGLRVQGKPALQRLDVFLRGDIEVQDEGSQLLALLTEAKRGEMVVDFCAGAGGKTLAIGAAMRSTGRLYAFDVSGHRLEALKPRLARVLTNQVFAHGGAANISGADSHDAVHGFKCMPARARAWKISASANNAPKGALFRRIHSASI